MKTEMLEEKLVQIIDGIQNAIASGTDQIPYICQEIITYTLWWKFLLVFSMLFMSILSIFSFIYFLKSKHDDAVTGVFFSLVGISISFLIFICNLPDLLRVCFAPKLYVLEYIRIFLR